MDKYKRKFLVPGDTVKTCWDMRWKCRELREKTNTANRYPCNPKSMSYQTYESKCPFPINKPTEYIVSETNEGEWQCSCPAWKFRREECNHIRKAKADPKKYEIDAEWTGKTVETIKKVTDL